MAPESVKVFSQYYKVRHNIAESVCKEFSAVFQRLATKRDYPQFFQRSAKSRTIQTFTTFFWARVPTQNQA